MPASDPEKVKRSRRRAQKSPKRRKGFRAMTAAQRHRSQRGRRYTRKLRATLAESERKLANARKAADASI